MRIWVRSIGFIVFAFGVLFQGSLHAKEDYEYVKSPEEYRWHMELHQVRVLIVALYILKNFPEEFPEIQPQDIVEAFALHDILKIITLPEHLALFKIHKQSEHFANLLFEYYGKNKDDLEPDDKERAIATFQSMNRYEKTIKKVALQLRGKKRVRINRLEHLADVIEREFDPVSNEELGGESKSARLFLRHQRDKALYDKIGMTQKRYNKIVSDFDFVSWANQVRSRNRLTESLQKMELDGILRRRTSLCAIVVKEFGERPLLASQPKATTR